VQIWVKGKPAVLWSRKKTLSTLLVTLVVIGEFAGRNLVIGLADITAPLIESNFEDVRGSRRQHWRVDEWFEAVTVIADIVTHYEGLDNGKLYPNGVP
jgi:hypothetical protein